MVQDLTMKTYSAFDLAKIIEGGHYNNIFYYEFHNEISPEGIDNCLEGLDSFRQQSEDYYKIFIDKGYEDVFPAAISIAINISGNWYIAEGIGFNYYSGTGPRGILKLREACAKKGIIGRVITDEFRKWIAINLKSAVINKRKYGPDQIQFEKIINSLKHMSISMHKSPSAYIGLKEENIRDKLLMPLNTIFQGRANAEAKSVNGKTDIMIKAADGLNEYVFELKVWNGEKGFLKAIEQLRSYLSWDHYFAGLVLFSYVDGFSSILSKIDEALRNNSNFKKAEKISDNEFRFHISNQSDEEKTISIHLIVINLRTK